MDAMKRNSPLHFLSLLLLPMLAAGAKRVAMSGGWQPIKDMKEPHMVEIGEFAVTEYDKRSKADLKFESVVEGETQVVSGTNYRLIVAAMDGSAKTNKYEAIVWEKTWEKFMNLTSFKPL